LVQPVSYLEAFGCSGDIADNDINPRGARTHFHRRVCGKLAQATVPGAALPLLFGGFLALANLLQQRNPPPVVSISYGEAEALDGTAENFYIYELYKTAAAEGVSVFVSSGDEDAASSSGGYVSTYGIGVSGFTSTPYNISVGGTDFGNIPLGSAGTYFNTANGPNFQSAVSYIPEIPWNDSCAGSLLVSAIGAPFTTYGPDSVCNNYLDFITQTEADEAVLLNAVGGSGGPSACATGNPQLSGVVSGSCVGWAKPYWQKLVGVPRDGVRDIPDVSLFASNGFWGVFYAVCISDPTGSSGFTPCTGDPSTWAGFGGTSISSPIWAGIQALVNQKTGQRWGNSNTVLYSLAAAEYGESGNAACNSSLGNAIGANCLFNDAFADHIPGNTRFPKKEAGNHRICQSWGFRQNRIVDDKIHLCSRVGI